MFTITTDAIINYSQCPRKAFLNLHQQEEGTPNEYVQFLERQRVINREKQISHFKQQNQGITAYSVNELNSGAEFLIEANLQFDKLAAYCDILKKVSGNSSNPGHHYQPIIISSTEKVTQEQRLELSFIGYVLEKIQSSLPRKGDIIDLKGNVHHCRLENLQNIQTIVHELTRLSSIIDPPPIILNKHCPYCRFQTLCKSMAQKEDNLSLLERLTPKLIRRYYEKGIFTVKQLSYSYKHKRPRKQKKKIAIIYKPELHALAIRTGKIYIQHLPDLRREQVELFVDIEGIPDRGFYYLIGLRVYESGFYKSYSFWAESPKEEQQIWNQFFEKINEYPQAPIYHYGSFEARSIQTIIHRYQWNDVGLSKRLVNLNSYIFGHLYFPVYSNRLKDIGGYIGAKWTAPEASGLLSLIWRHQWEETKKEELKQSIILYNQEDCQALQLLADTICKIRNSADTEPSIDYGDRPKRQTTKTGKEIHEQFQMILKFAHTDYDARKINFDTSVDGEKRKRGAVKGHPGYYRIPPQTAQIQKFKQREICPKCKNQELRLTDRLVQFTVTDLIFTETGFTKKHIRFEGYTEYCSGCHKYYNPEKLRGHPSFGHAFQSWIIYQRFSLRLPYESITDAFKEQFNEYVSGGVITNTIIRFAKLYRETEELSLERLLESHFIHADETKVNIQGAENYVWVFTDGKRVILRMSETREPAIAYEILKDYKGILVSDFYGGYDSLPCLQQKCWVHLIRDLNEDLWKHSFDEEYQNFVFEIRKLIVPIIETIHKFGLQREHLCGFSTKVDAFYKEIIENRVYTSEHALKYQKRFTRYRQRLFTFLDQDGIPWNNNMAERALRHLVVQENISKTFFKSVFPHYLVLLGIMQTCRFQQKSFLKFLLSEQRDVDLFQVESMV